MSDEQKYIQIRGARTHNLRDISLDIPRDKLVVITGLSGSGKSSLAFDTIYAEGQRKYVESLSVHARQFLGQMTKPDVDQISGLPPTIAIAQQSARGNPRSTVATATEIHDFLRLLFARVGTPHCPKCGRPVSQQTIGQIVQSVVDLPESSRVMILAPVVRRRAGEQKEVLARVQRDGFVRVRVDGTLCEAKDVSRLEKNLPHDIDVVVDRLILKPDLRTRLSESVETALRLADGLVVVSHQGESEGKNWHDSIYSERYACIECDIRMPALEPRLFSFNSPHGACPSCDGLGTVPEFDPELVVPDPSAPLGAGAVEAWRGGGPQGAMVHRKLVAAFCKYFGVSPATPFKALPAAMRDILLNGTKPEDEKRYGCSFEGVMPNLQRRWADTKSESVKDRLHAYMSERPCAACCGARLRPESLAVRIDGRNIDDLTHLSLDAAAGVFDSMRFAGDSEAIAAPILREIRQRLQFMIDTGIGYLTLNRRTGTLSGGESQRIRLATQVGSGLVGVCYVLDEPTIGLHARDGAKLIRTLRDLTALGNTLLVVEHDAEMIAAAEWIVDVGPEAGAHGGRVLVNGPRDELLKSTDSITAQYLRGERRIARREQVRKTDPRRAIEVKKAAENNLKSIDACFPLGVFCCVTGVSGSGKSTLVNQILLPGLRRKLNESRERPGAHERLTGISQIDKVIEIDQSPIGRTPRSNPATYTGVLDYVRELFAATREAKMRGYSAARFSFNVKGGRCETCRGHGTRRIEMHFLPDIFVACPECRGTRYSRETLEIRYRGKSIADVLDMRVEEAIAFFDSFQTIRNLLVALDEVGLGYIALGQSSATLSGGEAQRVKLAAELGKAALGHTLYVLDEPTSGLHFADIHRLVDVLNRLCDKGHSLVVIEHNLEVIKQADWIIDLGPEGGDTGGRIVAEGTPYDVAANSRSYTGHYLKAVLG